MRVSAVILLAGTRLTGISLPFSQKVALGSSFASAGVSYLLDSRTTPASVTGFAATKALYAVRS